MDKSTAPSFGKCLTMNLGLALGMVILAQSPAWAQSQGTWFASVGATSLHPSVSSGDLSAPSLANTKVDVNSDTQPTLILNYMVTDHWSLSVPLGAGFKHNITGAGAIAGTGVLGTTKVLPITALLQYRLGQSNELFRPYLGVGVTYAKFYNTNGTGNLTGLTNPGSSNATTLSIDSKWAATFQAGVTYAFTERVYLDLNLTKTILSTDSHLSTGQSISIGLDPMTYSVGLGYRF